MIDYKNTLKLIKKIDWKLILIVLAIFAYGLVILSSATHANQTGQYKRLIVQTLAFGIGTVIVIFILMIDYNAMGKHYKELYAVSIALLALVLKEEAIISWTTTTSPDQLPIPRKIL